MSIFSGSKKIGKIYRGSTSIGKVYKGSELVYQSAPKYYCYHGDKTPYSSITIFGYPNTTDVIDALS